MPAYAAWLLWTAVQLEPDRLGATRAAFAAITALAGLLLVFAWRWWWRLSWQERCVVLTASLLSAVLGFYATIVFEGNRAHALLWLFGGTLVIAALAAYVGHFLLLLGPTPRPTVLATVSLVAAFLAACYAGNFHGGGLLAGG